MRIGCDSAKHTSSTNLPLESTTYCRSAFSSEEFDGSDSEDVGQPGFKKIKPVDGLVLKTPIAFRNDSDIDMIPIRKEGMAVCEKCGAIGVKHSFYTKERRFCSQACAKSFNENPQANAATLEKQFSLQPGLQPGQQPVNRKMGQPVEDVHVFSNKRRMQLAKEGPEKDKYGFDWIEMLTEFGFVTPPISCFRHAPVCDTWASDVSVGMKVEVENTDTRQPTTVNGDPQSYWVASVISLMGYKALLRYEGFGTDDSKDFWVNLAAEDVHPVGWCASKGKPLIPPRTIQDKYTEWREFLVKRLTGARSLPNQFHNRVIEACRSRFRVGMTLEIVDRNNLSMMKVATVEAIVGRRLKLRYADAHRNDDGGVFWCHEESALIHPVGWALSVGHQIDAVPAYLERCTKRSYLPTDATGELFNEVKQWPAATGPSAGLKFKEGMKLEAVDPLNLDKICVASVVKVLRHGYLMIRIDRRYEDDDEDDDDSGEDSGTFCYHSTSACIAPPGFCEANAITLHPPGNYEGGRFRWGDYLRQTKSAAAPEALFYREESSGAAPATPNPQLRVGMRVEAADLMDSRLVCVATVAQVAGRLVRIHFDGWTDEFDQWMDSSSSELYPVGWCELAGYRLETPEAGNLHQSQPTSSTVTKKKGKSSSGRGGRGKARRGRGAGRPSTGSQPTAVKRERSPSTDDAVSSRQAAASTKSAKLNQTMPARSRSQETTVRSLRPRSSLQHTVEDVKSSPPVTDGNDNDHGEAITNATTDAVKRAKEVETSSRNSGRATVVANQEQSSGTNQQQTNGTSGTGKRIPRLIDVAMAHRKEVLAGVNTADWTTEDVAEFLRINGYAAYCDAFTKEMIDGPALMSLNKDQVLQLTNMKVGPSVKIFDLIGQLKPRSAVTNNGASRQALQNSLR